MIRTAQPLRVSLSWGQEVACLLAWSILPMASGESPPDSRSPTPAQELVSSTAVKRSLRILIIEDNQDYAEGLGMLFELRGHLVTVTYSGIEGVRAALSHPPDVVICDIGLPGMDGFEVARTLRQNPLTAGVRLIAVTGYGSERDVQYSAECGFYAYLVKPVEVGDILKLIDRGDTKGH